MFAEVRRIYIVEADGSRLQSLFSRRYEDNFDADLSPSVSPDGTRVAFFTSRHKMGWFGGDRVYEIGTSALDGSDYQRLTNSKGGDINPVWSPDGTRLAFVSVRADPRGSVGLSITSADGSDSRFVTPPSLRLTKDTPVWSPDGRRLAFLATESEPDNSKAALYTVAVDGGDLRKIYETDVQPAWSPDGSRIAFAVAEDGQIKLYAVSPDGSDLQEISDRDSPISFSRVSNLTWSLDGTEIRFGERRRKRHVEDYRLEELGIHAIKVDGSGFRTIIDFGGYDARTAWSPDGSRIAVRSDIPETPGADLYTVASDGSDSRVLVRGEGGVLVAANSDWRDVTEDIRACSEGFVVPDPEENQGLVQDCETLLSIRNTLAGENVVLGWSSDIPIADWAGVGVRGEPLRVRYININRMNGTIPAEMGNLAELEELHLTGSPVYTTPDSTKRFSGSIPAELGKLSKLEFLNLIDNDLSGSIPSELGQLSNLRWLHLRNNGLTGEIPSELGNTSSLEELDLGRNKLTGEIPPELGNLNSLVTLEMESNNLTGEFPPELGRLANLKVLNVDSNNLTGCVPTELLERKALLRVSHEGLDPC